MRNKIIKEKGVVLLVCFFISISMNCSVNSGRENADTHSQNKVNVKNEAKGSPDHEESEDSVTISTDAVKLAGIVIDSVRLNRIGKKIIFPGEIGFNEERLHRVIPRFPGIIKAINKRIGEKVLKGELLAKIQSNEGLSTYNIVSKISGIVIKKDIIYGEFAGEGKVIFVIADFSSVWLKINVFPKSVKHLNIGMEVKVFSLDGERTAMSKIISIIPVIDLETRCMTARSLLKNRDNNWYPGTFVNCEVLTNSSSDVPVVFSESIQIINDEPILFVPERNNEFRIVHIVVGRSNEIYTEIIKGVFSGDKYVRKGSFELKAKIITGTMSGHAGHGH